MTQQAALDPLRGPVSLSVYDKVTVFSFGYLMGPRQIEVATIQLGDGHQSEVATFVERGKRKSQKCSITDLVVIDGWGHPPLETLKPARSGGLVGESRSVVREAKFHAFAPEWDDLVDAYLVSLGPGVSLIFDGRKSRPPSSRPTLAEQALGATPAAVECSDEPARPADHEGPTATFEEGAPVTIELTRYERDPVARQTCLMRHGHACQVCGLNMADIYGELGKGFIHVHHVTPLSEIRESYRVDPDRDLVPVCPNCHAMLHRTTPPIEVETLAKIVADRRTVTG